MRCPGLRIGESLLLLSPFFAVLGSAQQSTSFAPVTLWQVGQGHLLQGSIATLPLEILGAASDGSSTTYLYQAVNLATVTLTTEGKTTTQISPSPTPRTIVASSSGWVERFPSATTTNSIGCFLINSISGACFSGTSIINTGAPTPEVLVVTSLSTSTPTTLPSTSATTTSAPTSSASGLTEPQSTGKDSKHNIGAIIGGILGGVAGITITVVLFMISRRRKQMEKKLLPQSYDLNASFTTPDDTRGGMSTFTTVPHPEASVVSLAGKGIATETNASLIQSIYPRSRTSGSETPLMREIVNRLERLEGSGSQEPPPRYGEDHDL